MKMLKRELADMLDQLKALTRKAEKMKRRLKAVERSQAMRAVERIPARVGPERRADPGGKERAAFRDTAITSIFGIIRRSRRGVTTAQIMRKTGFHEKKIWNVVNRLKSQGLVRSAEKGVYIKG